MYRFLAVACVVLVAGSVHAQAERYELGRRLKAFEASWEKHEDAEARRRALAILPAVTAQFFALNLGEAGRTLDRAAFALQTEVGAGVARQWLWSLSPLPATRVIDGAATELEVTIKPFYPVKVDLPRNLELRLWFTNKHLATVKPAALPVTVRVPLPPLGDARGLDRKLYFLADGGKGLTPIAVGVSQVADLESRVRKLGERTAGPASTIEQATARSRAALLRSAIDPKNAIPPTDLPYAQLLANAEAMLDGKHYFTAARSGQFWLTVPIGEREAVPCRVYIPRGLDAKKPVPVVVALHGAGVDENMFFEGYGSGQAVKECEKRGWMLVAPRSGLALGGGPDVAAIVSKLAGRYPIRKDGIFVVGHSMGAGQALAQAPGGRFAAIAVLGGGGRIKNPRDFAALPTFIGVGERDTLALDGSRSLNRLLVSSGARAITFKEYPGVEHLVIVRSAIADVFALFDAVAAK